jgi:hypothetical protein
MNLADIEMAFAHCARRYALFAYELPERMSMRAGCYAARIVAANLSGRPGVTTQPRRFSTTVKPAQRVANASPLNQIAVTSLLDRGDMDEDVVAGIVGLDEAIAFGCIKPLTVPSPHVSNSQFKQK